MAARFWVGGSGTWNNTSTTNWSTTSGGAAGAAAPTSADTATFDSNSGTAATITVASTAVSSSTVVNKADINLSLSGSPTLCISTGSLNLTTGTITLNNNTLTVGIFISNNSNVRAVAFGTGAITLTGSGTTIWTTAVATNFSYTGTPTVNATYSGSTGTRTITTATAANGGVEANALSFNVSAGSDTVSFGSVAKNVNFTGFSGTINNATRTIYGNLTFSSGMTLTAGTTVTTFAATSGTQQITTAGKTLDFPLTFNGIGGTFAFQDALTQGSTRAFTITNGTVQLKNGVTSTVGSFVANNTSSKFLQSTLLGSQATLSQASGTVNVADLTIRDINAIGGASWNAYTDFENTDAGNNDGWDFSLSPPYSTAELPVTLRPFTQPRRF